MVNSILLFIPNFIIIEDIDDCGNRTCFNGGTCVDGVNSFTCNCAKGYTGNHCQTGNTLLLINK